MYIYNIILKYWSIIDNKITLIITLDEFSYADLFFGNLCNENIATYYLIKMYQNVNCSCLHFSFFFI